MVNDSNSHSQSDFIIFEATTRLDGITLYIIYYIIIYLELIFVLLTTSAHKQTKKPWHIKFTLNSKLIIQFRTKCNHLYMQKSHSLDGLRKQVIC